MTRIIRGAHTCLILPTQTGSWEILLQQRQLNGHWEFQGGGVKPGEHPHHAAYRELFHELCLERFLAVPEDYAALPGFNTVHEAMVPHRSKGHDVCFLIVEADLAIAEQLRNATFEPTKEVRQLRYLPVCGKTVLEWPGAHEMSETQFTGFITVVEEFLRQNAP